MSVPIQPPAGVPSAGSGTSASTQIRCKKMWAEVSERRSGHASGHLTELIQKLDAQIDLLR